MLQDWQSAIELSEAAQRELLASDDPTERLWAAWALTLRLGHGSLATTRQLMTTEPASGIRCQLVVVLAGLGERALLRTISVTDPDPVVRSTACQYVIRTLPIGSPDALTFALERMRSDVPRVGQALLEEALLGRLRFPDAVVLDRLTASDLEGARIALQILRNDSQLSPASSSYVIQNIPILTDSDLRAGCIGLVLRDNHFIELVHCATSAPEAVATVVLDALAQAGARFSWTELQSLATRPEASVWIKVLDLFTEPLEPDAIRWLSNKAALGLELQADPPSKVRTAEERFSWHAFSRLYDLLTPTTVRLLDRVVAQVLLNQFLYDRVYDEGVEPQEDDLKKKELLESCLGQ